MRQSSLKNTAGLKNKTGFTLTEVVVSITVFAVLIVTASSTFVMMQQSWTDQKNDITIIGEARWAMEQMATEYHRAVSISNPNNNNCGNTLTFNIRDRASSSTTRQIEYRLQGNALQREWDNSGDWFNLTDNVVNPSSGSDRVFCRADPVITIRLIMKPYPNRPEGRGNRNETIITAVRSRN